MLLNAARSHLIVVDMQERLMPAIHGGEGLLPKVRLLLRAAERLRIPVTVTEQYPKGLGPTIPQVADLLPAGTVVLPKVSFSAAGDEATARRIAALRGEGRDQVVICGIEAHVCVLQTALALHATGLAVFVVSDAVSSRAPSSVSAACARLLHAGCHWIDAEMALFEWLEKAGTDDFRALSALLK
ncbi:isochorismatase family protein [Microvirga thermotolerans]|uniref:Isochorismatase family protein n=1 Tax=Microvirga thermotolerans TaxID=2651334 RepID=A0A5P9JXG0_9HYPH|nr:isochorismatase family protein [Microvirga thermotolerans]QFU17113.1 isochorismatase family protein [Microvirga thermotolerans]